ncbi:MAG: hypothetical protein IPH00_00270 [Flavobacteriales bacterium]|nr:hypothetical protein [Flavobacteriales bacterium]MBK7286452.1 hypothetical protein [Flavobacteriales bacterium]QQS72813.1 MAG: hypothetical protein IPP95_00820 [Flavobacteriales bacterium]HQV37530.1 hypothetical protein [Flavobacteriales bacterium]HQW31220.1 hypothetical protein [Flavobacteriales bacterium]
MGEIIASAIGYILTVFIFRYPGALILYHITGRRKTFDHWADERLELSGGVGMLAVGLVIGALVYFS